MADTVLGDAWLEGAGRPVPVRGTCSLGRSASNDIVLRNGKVSRRHAIIHRQGDDEYWLVDFGSTNGTLVNGRRVVRPTLLQDSDRILLGEEGLVFRKNSSDALHRSRTSPATVREIRTVAVWLLVADVEGSTRLARECQAEELSMLVGGWFDRCKEIIDGCGGQINQFLGDGYFAYWRDDPPAVDQVSLAVKRLSESQGDRPAFRWVLHYGEVALGGQGLVEESLCGGEVHYVFRMEKLAAKLKLARLLSGAAQTKLCLPGTVSAGSHELEGFKGTKPFHTFTCKCDTETALYAAS
jgi:pSer/pThr/pTyr-binding forkhead associated (FHA) protein